MALKLISSGLGKFVKEIIENSKPTVLVEMPEMMESANSINVTEMESIESAVSAESPKSVESLECMKLPNSVESSKNMDIAKESVDEPNNSDKVVPVNSNASSPQTARPDLVITNVGSPTTATIDPVVTNASSPQTARPDLVITNVGSPTTATIDPVVTNAGSPTRATTDRVVTNADSPKIATIDPLVTNAGSPTRATTDRVVTNADSPKIATTDRVVTNADSLKTATTDPIIINVDSPETASRVNSAESTNCLMDYIADQKKIEQLSVNLKMVFTNSSKCSQTGDWSVELAEYLNSAEQMNDIEPIQITAEYIENTESTRTIESERELMTKCIQTTYMDEQTVSAQSVITEVVSEFLDPLCSVANGENTAFHKSTKSLAGNKSNENFAAAKSSVKFYEEQLLRTLDSPPLSESDSSTINATSPQENETAAEQSDTAFVDSGLAQATKNNSHMEPVEKVHSEVELSSTSFSLEDDNMLSGDKDCLFSDFELNAYSMTFDSEAQLINYGDVSSTNNVGLGGGAYQHEPIPQTDMSQKSMNSIPDLSDLFDVLGEDELNVKGKQCAAPAVVKPNYPEVVATSPDSTGNGLQLRSLPCAIIVQRMEKKFPQYAHLLSTRKRKANNVEDSTLKKKIRTETIYKIPLGTNRANHNQPQGPEKSAHRTNDSSASSFKRPKSKKRKRSRERLEHDSNKTSSTQAKRTVEVGSNNSVKVNFNNYRIPKIKKGSSNDAKKENTPKRRDSISTTCKSSDASRNEGNPINSKNSKASPKYAEKKPIDAASSQNLDRSKHSDKRSSGSEKLPGMPVLDDFQEPMNVEVASSQPEPVTNTPSSSSCGGSKVICDRNISNFDSRMTTCINGSEGQDKKKELKSILKKKTARLSSKTKTRFADRHSFVLIECENESSSYPKYYLLPERYILNDINGRYLAEENEVIRLSLKLTHQCWTESRTIHNSKFDFIENIDKLNRTSFEEHIKELLYSRLRKTMYEIERSAITTTEVEFSIEVFDTSDKKYWKIILKRKIDANEIAQFEIGDIVSLTLFTKSRKSEGSWKKTLIFAYTEETEVKEKEAVFQKVSFCVLPIDEEVKRDQVKIQKIINIGQQLRLFAAFSVIPYSPIVDLFTHELKSAVPTTDNLLNEMTESEQSLAVDQCYEGVYSDNPFLYFIDGAPGTGKSCFIVKLIKKLFSKNGPDCPLKILMVTQSDASADDFLHRLIKVSSSNLNIMRYCNGKTVHPSLKKYTLDDTNCILQKPNHSFDVDLEKRLLEAEKNAEYFSYDTTVPKESCEKTLVLKKRQEALVNDAAVTSELKKSFMKEAIIGSADVVVMPRNACYGKDFLKDFVPCPSNKGIFNKFSVCIFDDANEISEIDLLIPIMTMVSNVLFVGDSRNPASKDGPVTPFTRLLEKYKKSLPKNVTNFKTQFRVHPKIVDCLSKMNLSINSTPENNESKLALKPLMIVDLYCEDESLDYSKRLERQAQFCQCIVQNIHKVKEFGNLDIGVLVGNKKLKIIVRHELKSNPEILVDKTAGFCGLEKDIIIVCLPPLLFPEKFLYNAMTRAKRSVIVCGDFSQFKGQTTIEQMVANATRRKCFQRWDKNPCDFPFRTMRLFIKNGEVTT